MRIVLISDAKYAAQDLRDWTEPKQQSTVVEGVENDTGGKRNHVRTLCGFWISL